MYLQEKNYYETIEYNRKRVYALPAKYPNLQYYLDTSLRADLLAFFKYAKKHNVIANNQYITVIDNKKLTYKVRKKAGGNDTTNRHFNLLCCLGLIKKVTNVSGIEIEQNFLRNNPKARRPINAYTVSKYTDAKLRECENRAKQLKKIKVNLSNISYNMLCVHGLSKLANEVFPLNNRSSPQKKQLEYEELRSVLSWIIEEEGYCTRAELLSNLAEIDKYEFKRLLKIYKEELNREFIFKRPKKEEVEKWGLNKWTSIYIRRSSI